MNHQIMPIASENNKRIAKNTLLLYFRMLLTMTVSLYTSRVVLSTLGVEDYGIYNVVGGVVSMFSFLNASMVGATSRFLTYEIGKGDYLKLKDTFSSALIIHIGIALVIFILAETIGLWFLMNKLVIPVERMYAAQWVYQLSVFSMMISVTQVPYNATIIAYEKMNIYAYVEILNVVLKLVMVYLLFIGNFDKLILYAFLILLVTVIIAFIYRIYCIRRFEECRFHWVWNLMVLKPMLSFSSWDLYGNMSVMMRQQGVNILLNIFFGPILNAASAVASQILGAVGAFTSNVLMASKPQIIKQYASKEYLGMITLLSNTIRINFILMSILTIPLICEIEFVLGVWLKEVPPYAVTFCVYTLLFNAFANISTILVSGIHATGKIWRPSLINGTLYLLVVPFSYFAYMWGAEVWIAYLFNVVAVFLGMLSNAYTLKLYVREFSLRLFILKDLFLCVSIFLLVCWGTYSLHCVMKAGWLRLMISIIASFIALIFIGYRFMLSTSMKVKVQSYLYNKILLWKKA